MRSPRQGARAGATTPGFAQALLASAGRVRPALQWALLLVGVAIVSGLVAISTLQERRRLESDEQERLRNLSRALASSVARQLQGANRALEVVLGQLAHERPASGAGAVDERLVELCEALPGVRTLVVMDARGVIVAANRPELVGRDLNQRDYFLAPRRAPSARTLYVSEPFQTVLGAWVINVSRAIVGSDGRFEGVVSASLDPDYFQLVLSSGIYAPDMRTVLFHANGVQFVVVPPMDGRTGANLAQPGTLFSRFREGGREEDVLEGISFNSGELRWVAMRLVRPDGLHMDEALGVASGRRVGAVLGPWRRDLSLRLALLAAFALASAGGLLFSQHRQRALERHRRAAGDAERRSTALHRAIASSFPDGAVLLFDRELRYLVAGGAALQEMGYASPGLEGRTAHEVLPPEALARLEPIYRAALAGCEEQVDLEARGRIYELRTGPVKGVEGEGPYAIVTAVDVTARREEKRKLAEALAANETLLREVHHRVKNNLQVVSSLLRLQLRKLAPGTARDALQDCEGRVQSIAAFYERLHCEQGEGVDALTYLRDVARSALDAGAREGVTCEVSGGTFAVHADAAVPCGLIVNELLTNALKHAFPGGRAGRVWVRTAVEGVRVRVEVSDDGVGLGPEALARSSLGLRLVASLANQLGGRLETVAADVGATFRVEFPLRPTH